MKKTNNGKRSVRWQCVFLAGFCATLPIATCAAEADFTIEARDFDSGNVRVSLTGQQYAGGPSCIWNGGSMPNLAEYEIEFPVTADYALAALYAAAQARPVEISLDGKTVHTGFTSVTGDWNTASARWEEQCTLRVARGTHTIALRREGAMPHICALRLRPCVPFPQGFHLKRPDPEQRVQRSRVKANLAALEGINLEAVRLAIEDMEKDFPGRYDGATHKRALGEFERGRKAMLKSLAEGKQDETNRVERLLAGVRAALLANPLLDFDKLLVVRRNFAGGRARQVTGEDAGFVRANYLNQTSMPRADWDNEIGFLSNLRGQPRFDRLYKPSGGRIVRDVRLDFPADRMLFSSIDADGRWAIYEIRGDGSGLAQLTPTDYPDLDFFDACYLPDGRIVLCSTGNYFGLPCLNGNGQIASLYLLDPSTKSLRQLTFDQDSDNDPTVLNDGRILYQRWEYSDIPHYFARRRMSMNPDGTGQLALYGSNSWFPTAFRFAKAVPDHPTRLVGIISGHHDFGDCGRMAILDPGLASAYPFRYRPSSKEWGVEGQPIAVTPEVLPAAQTGFVQLIPGRGKTVAGTVCDAIMTHVYRKELPALTTHPYPLSSKYFLVSMKPTPESLWGIYLVDVFDNATRIAEMEGAALFEPQPLAARTRPPVIPDRVAMGSRTATVHIADIYRGPGLQGVPRGTVQSLRVFSYHFGYNDKAGFPLVGTQAGWDVKRVLGTAAVERDGSAYFQIPANTPISIQPLDNEGRAVQLMRSWLVGMPGEHLSCVGCHENRMVTLPTCRSTASQRSVEPLKPWYGAPRPFAFSHEVFPVLEKYCMGCHDGAPVVGPRSNPSFKDSQTAYDTLHPYVHRPGVESDMALLYPMEYHASTSPLIQMLDKGHYGVQLAGMDREARERLYCWIDLNVPQNGRWSPPPWQDRDQRQRRCELAKAFAGNDADPEAEDLAAEEVFNKRTPIKFIGLPQDEAVQPDGLRARGFPLTALEARRLQQANLAGAQKVIDLGDGIKMSLTWIPAGEFVMGSLDGAPDERPRALVRVGKPFWMAVTEVTNGQYALFDPKHDTRYIDMHSLDRVVPGHIANHPDQPVARVSWLEAMRFCRWMSGKTGLKVALPTEAQWEWAARAGAETQFFYGTMESDFGRFANLADQSLRWYKMGYDGPSALQRRHPYPPEMNFPLHDERFRDKWYVVDYAGQTEANAWGLKDVVGNASEWTRSSYRFYPYVDDDGRNDETRDERKAVRGGSWADRPADAGSSVRRAFEPWQRVYDVGFRVVVEDVATAPQIEFAPDAANELAFPAAEAKFVRLVIRDSTSRQPCLDELEVYADGAQENLALASGGAKAVASSCLPGYAIHKIEHLNDGQYGNSRSWIASAKTGQWAQIELAATARVARVVFSRDRAGKYLDRVPVGVEIRLSMDGARWTAVRDPSLRQRWSGSLPAVPPPSPPPQTAGAAARPATESRINSPEALEGAFSAEEHAWLKTYGRADLDRRLVDTPYREKRYPEHASDDRLPLASLSTAPVLDGAADDPCWLDASRGVVRVAEASDFASGPLVEHAVTAGRLGDDLFLAIRVNRLLSSHLAVISTGDAGSAGVLALDGRRLVFRRYVTGTKRDSQGKTARAAVLGEELPVDGAMDSVLTCFEARLPLAWFADAEQKGLRVGLGIGGKHTDAAGRPVEFVFSSWAMAEVGPCVDRQFRVRVGLAGDAEPATLRGNLADLAGGLPLQPGESRVVVIPAERGPIGPEFHLRVSDGREEYTLELFRYDPLERTLSLMEAMLGRWEAKGQAGAEDASPLTPNPSPTRGEGSRELDLAAEREELIAFRRVQESLQAAPPDHAAERKAFLAARLAKRNLFLREPDLAPLGSILFTKRHAFEPSHNYSDPFDSKWRPGGGVYTLAIPRRDGRLMPAEARLDCLFDAGAGVARNPMADFEVRRIYFAWRPSEDAYYHLMVMNPGGSGAEQLTDGPYHDYWPCPTPDGRVAFITTRCRSRYICWRPQAAVLFSMDADGRDPRPLSLANLTEWAPSVMRDGRIIWTRSEYQDKGADYSHTLWAIRPDGTMPELVFGNTILLPQGYANGREVPGTSEICCTLISHFGDLNGPIALCDTSLGRFNAKAIACLTPEVPWPGFSPLEECFRDPVPVARDYFLVSHAPRSTFGLYVIDRYGNREVLHLDPALGSMEPTLFGSAPTPPVLATAIDEDLARQGLGEFAVADVYQGIEHVVPPGSVKYLRVAQEVRADLLQLPDGSFQQDHNPFMQWYATPVDRVSGPYGWPSYAAKGTWGIVPVEEDGSASFLAPAGKVLYFQLLDRDFNEIQRMRSLVQVQPGERRSCIGCHEDRRHAPPARAPIASGREPRRLTPEPWGAGPFSYEKVVQPVLDARCVRCHDVLDKQGINLAGALDADRVPASYRTLIGQGWVHHLDWGFKSGENQKAEPLSFGTVKSRLWQVLDRGHYDATLTRDQMRALKCWTDLNCPLWPDYVFRPLRPATASR